jgi:hypothetical protein
VVRPFDGVDVAFRSPQQFFRHEHVPHSDLLIDWTACSPGSEDDVAAPVQGPEDAHITATHWSR